jgi:hypothetical protein
MDKKETGKTILMSFAISALSLLTITLGCYSFSSMVDETKRVMKETK